MKRAMAVTTFVLVLSASVLSGCAAYVYGAPESEDMSDVRSFGESVVVDYSFDLLGVYQRGPYELEVTPLGVETIHRKDGSEVDCVKVAYEVLATNDGQPADFANCTVVTNVLRDDLSPVDYSTWLADDQGNEMDAVGSSLEIGKEYVFYIPLEQSLGASGLKYVTVSDRSGYYERSGDTYWYSV